MQSGHQYCLMRICGSLDEEISKSSEMYRDYRVILCIPCGRRKYLEVLFQTLQQLRPCIDVCEMWMNTAVKSDRDFCMKCHEIDPSWLKMIELPSDRTPSKDAWRTVHPFYSQCCDPKTIYIKCDDDVFFVDKREAFHRFLDFRIDHPDYFLVSANIVNSPVCTHYHQAAGLLPGVTEKIAFDWQDRQGMSGRVGEAAHLSLIENGPAAFHMKNIHLQAYERFSINLISWLGEDFEPFQGSVPEVDEEFLTTTKPRTMQRNNIIFGKFVVAHFAFAKQRAHMDSTNLLGQYTSWLHQTIKN